MTCRAQRANGTLTDENADHDPLHDLPNHAHRVDAHRPHSRPLDTPVTEPAPAKFCGSCGKPVPVGTRFCGACGRPTAMHAAAKPVARSFTSKPPAPIELTLRRSELSPATSSGVVSKPRAAKPSPAGASGVIRIGRAADNDRVIPDLLVSNHHAELRLAAGGAIFLVDVGSTNGTFVDGRQITAAQLTEGQAVKLGNANFRFHANQLVPVAALHTAAEPAIAAENLTIVVDDDICLLDDVSFSLPRGGFMAILGTTGAGKSTLLKALTGFQPPSAGKVLYDAQNFYECFDALRSTLGYVPQDDILHPQLSVRTALAFGAELRFPLEVSEAERTARIDEVLGELGLTDRADLPIERLSGGQRKRTSVALELLTKPSVLYLDEPTSGLDPGYEKSVMETLRALADGGRSVVVVTHSVASLHLCDQVLFLAPGGKVAFCGAPDEALTYFGVREFADIFSALEHDHTTDWKQRFSAGPGRRGLRRVRERPPARAIPPSPQTWSAQVRTLCRRQWAVLIADRRNLWFLGIEMVVPALLLFVLVGSGALDPSNAKAAHDSRILLGAMSVTAVAIGAANSLREIVKEVPIYLRERAAGLMRTSYLVSKMLFVGAITIIQVSFIVALSGLRARGPRDAVALGVPLFELIFDISLAALAAVALGLLLSAIVSTSEKAMSLVAVIFIVQWLFSGVAVDLNHKPVMRPLAYTMSANWGMAAAGSTANLYKIIGSGCHVSAGSAGSSAPGRQDASAGGGLNAHATAQSPAEAPPSCDKRWHHSLGNWLTSVIAMLALIVAGLWAAGIALERKEPVKSKMPEPSPWQRAAWFIQSRLRQLGKDVPRSGGGPPSGDHAPPPGGYAPPGSYPPPGSSCPAPGAPGGYGPPGTTYPPTGGYR